MTPGNNALCDCLYLASRVVAELDSFKIGPLDCNLMETKTDEFSGTTTKMSIEPLYGPDSWVITARIDRYGRGWFGISGSGIRDDMDYEYTPSSGGLSRADAATALCRDLAAAYREHAKEQMALARASLDYYTTLAEE